MAMTEMVREHVFEVAGLGLAPFQCIGTFELPSQALQQANPEAYNNALRQMPRGFGCGTCALCGIAIMNNFLIRSSDRKTFSVGCECVKKTNDATLIRKVDAERRRVSRERSRAKADARRAQLRAEWAAKDAERQAERDAAEAAKFASREAQREACTNANAWLIAALREKTSSPFCHDIAQQLETSTFAGLNLSDRAKNILADIYGKRAGRHGSKANLAAIAEFRARTEATDAPV